MSAGLLGPVLGLLWLPLADCFFLLLELLWRDDDDDCCLFFFLGLTVRKQRQVIRRRRRLPAGVVNGRLNLPPALFNAATRCERTRVRRRFRADGTDGQSPSAFPSFPALGP